MSPSQNVEVRLFGVLKKFGDERGWPFPFPYELAQECSALDLVDAIGLPREKIEAVFVNGLAKPIDAGWIKPGDRVGFIPYGIPGPYRVLLGIRKAD